METATVQAGPTMGVASSTVADLLPIAVREHGDRRAVMYKEDGASSWTEKSYSCLLYTSDAADDYSV